MSTETRTGDSRRLGASHRAAGEPTDPSLVADPSPVYVLAYMSGPADSSAGALGIRHAYTCWTVKNQSVAAGRLGDASFQGGWSTAALGVALHIVIATTTAVVNYLVLSAGLCFGDATTVHEDARWALCAAGGSRFDCFRPQFGAWSHYRRRVLWITRPTRSST